MKNELSTFRLRTHDQIACVLSLLLLVMFSSSILAAVSGDYEYSDNGDGTCTITNYTGPGGHIIIQGTLDGLSVTIIGSSAFYEHTDITGITIPGSVTTIGDSAFEGCDGLITLTIPNSVNTIAADAFALCSGLISVTIPDSVTAIGSYAFWSCSSLTTIKISNSITTIEEATFASCTDLANLTIPDSVNIIGASAFNNCDSLTNLTIPDSVDTFGDLAFAFCNGLTGIYFKGDPPVLEGSFVFYDLSNAVAYYLPDATGWGATYGGLPTAPWPLSIADFDMNGDIDHYDFAIFAASWMFLDGEPEYNPACDISDPADGIVDSADLAVFADNWLILPWQM